jgi:hypothetical protein
MASRAAPAVCVILAACTIPSGAPRDGWIKPGASEQQREADLYLCEREMLVADAGRDAFRRCMEAKGYRRAE